MRPREELFVSTVPRNQVSEPVPARTPTFGTLDPQHAELADQVSEDDRASRGML
jgi:hypothetical protein